MTVPQTELGALREPGLYWPELDENTPELRWPLSVSVFGRMRREESQVASVLRAVKMPVRRTPRRIDGTGCRPEVVRLVADDLGLPIVGQDNAAPRRTRDRFSFSEHLRLALTSLDYGHCVDYETEALTQRGWVSGHDLVPGDMLWTLNPETGMAEWQPCEDVHRFDGQHVTRAIDTRSHSSVTTMNHRWIVRSHDSKKLRFKRTAELNTNDRIIRAAEPASLPTAKVYSDAFVELVAWYWTEGQEHPGGGACLWQSESANPEKSARIRAALTALYGAAKDSLRHGHGAPLNGWRERTRLGGVNHTPVTCFYLDVATASPLRSVAPGKIVSPKFIASLTPDQLRLFVDTSVDADGCSTGGAKNDRVTLAQSDPDRLLAFEMALTLLGVPWTRGKAKVGASVSVGKSQREIRPIFAAHRSDNRRSTDTVEITDGVWCPQVANRTWFARRRGTGYFTGNSVFEQVYRYDGGWFHLRKLGWRPPRTIAEWREAADGGLIGVQQNLATGTPAVIGVDRLVVYCNEREESWVGQSLLRPAYKYWLLKDQLLRGNQQTIIRNGMGVPVHTAPKAPDGMATEQAEAWEKEQVAAGLKLAKSVRSGDNAGASLAAGATLAMKGVEGKIPDAMPTIKYYDEQMAKSALQHFLTLGQETGSWALGTTFADFFTQSLQAVADQIDDVINAHVIEDLVDVNFGADEPAPRLVSDRIGASLSAESLKALVDAGVITPDQPLEAYTRDAYGLPVADPTTARRTSAATTTEEGTPHDQ